MKKEKNRQRSFCKYFSFPLQGLTYAKFRSDAKPVSAANSVTQERHTELFNGACVFCGLCPARGVDRLTPGASYTLASVPCVCVSPCLHTEAGCCML